MYNKLYKSSNMATSIIVPKKNRRHRKRVTEKLPIVHPNLRLIVENSIKNPWINLYPDQFTDLEDYVVNIIFNMCGGLLPIDLTFHEMDALGRIYGVDWFIKLQYTVPEYTQPY